MSKVRVITPVEAFLSRADGGSAMEFAALVESHGLSHDQLVSNGQILPIAAQAIADARLRRQDAERKAAEDRSARPSTETASAAE